MSHRPTFFCWGTQHLRLRGGSSRWWSSGGRTSGACCSPIARKGTWSSCTSCSRSTLSFFCEKEIERISGASPLLGRSQTGGPQSASRSPPGGHRASLRPRRSCEASIVLQLQKLQKHHRTIQNPLLLSHLVRRTPRGAPMLLGTGRGSAPRPERQVTSYSPALCLPQREAADGRAFLCGS